MFCGQNTNVTEKIDFCKLNPLIFYMKLSENLLAELLLVFLVSRGIVASRESAMILITMR